MMNVYQSVLSSLGLSTDKNDEKCKSFQKKDLLGAKLTGSGKGGDIVIFSPYPYTKDDLENKFGNSIVHYKSWKKNQKLDPILRVEKHYVTKIDLDEKLKADAFVGVLSKIMPESPNYKGSCEFSEEAIEQQREIVNDIKEAMKIAEDKSINLDVLIVPEYALPPESDEQHSEIIRELANIAKQKDIIIVGGSYLSKCIEDICLVFSPNGDVQKVWRLNRCKFDPKSFVEGSGIRIFENSRIGDFCIIVCYDLISEKEIPDAIKKSSRKGQSLSLIIISQSPDKTRYKNIAAHLSNPEGNPSLKGFLSHVIIADSCHGYSHYAAPTKKTTPDIEKKRNLSTYIGEK